MSKSRDRHKHKRSEVHGNFVGRRQPPPCGASGAAPGALRARQGRGGPAMIQEIREELRKLLFVKFLFF
eukprot:8169717-Pyramimonas_sp.AAC.1